MRFQPTTYIATSGQIGIVTSGLVFDFRAQDYVSGSLTWNAYVGNYTASVTGTVATPLISASTGIGFDGNHWLNFPTNMTASISSSNWEVYALIKLATTSSTSYKPTFFAKGIDAPGWYYSYQGGGTSNGTGYINYQGGIGFLTDNLNVRAFNSGLSGVFPNIPQQFVFSYPSSSTFPQGPYTLNWYGNQNGNSAVGDVTNISPLSFSGSVASNLTFGYGVDTWSNFSGSVVRLYAYNRILSLQERKNNWFALTGIYVK